MSVKIVSPQKCMGCYACLDVCRFQAIKMVQNKQGFYYPEINDEVCTDCSACEKKCPALTETCVPLGKCSFTDGKPSAYAVKCLDEKIRFGSASGGVFPALAKRFLSEGGIVFGAGFAEDWTVRHKSIIQESDISQLQSSKYAQSDMTGIYEQVGKCLKAGRKVMFTGTPCQIAALHNFLGGRWPEGIIVVDLFCHGVSSPGLLERYLKETVPENEMIHSIAFRHKERGWEKYNMRIEYGDNMVYSKAFRKDPFLSAFCGRVSLRESCYRCSAKGFPRHSDLTLGDFWMVDRVFPDMNDKKGVSIVLTNTNKGKQYLSALKDDLEIREIPEDVFSDIYQKSGTPVARPACRDTFFDLVENKSIQYAAAHLCKTPLKEALVGKVRIAMVKMGIYDRLRRLKKKRICANGEE